MLLLDFWHRITLLKIPMYNFFFSINNTATTTTTTDKWYWFNNLYVCFIKSSSPSQGNKSYNQRRNANHLVSWVLLTHESVSESKARPPTQMLTVSLVSVASHALFDVAGARVLWWRSCLGRSQICLIRKNKMKTYYQRKGSLKKRPQSVKYYN